ncbi:MAG: lipid-A-disaccharide synthase [Alphaproteobacteria bacterium]|jgi:lipid-A-disaccharide synthase
MTSSQKSKTGIEAASKKPLKIGLIVGETSGAILALGMVKQILAQYPNCQIEGIGSEALNNLGMRSLFDMNELSVMGLVEVIKHLPRLLHIRKTVVKHFLDNPPDIFIGVDAPDFNLRVETTLKAAGIPTVHYVSPTVWAWREKRIYKIAKATNLVLGVFPFEQQIYDKYSIPFKFVGHTMADDVPLLVDQAQVRQTLNLPQDVSADTPILALLPGSRAREIDSLLGIFLDTFETLKENEPELRAIIPAVNEARMLQIENMLCDNKHKHHIVVTREPARDVMIAANAVLLASGTAALEAMLCKRPMVVAYIMPRLTHMIMKRMYKPNYFALPNILANELLVPEFLQKEVNAANLAKELNRVWRQDSEITNMIIEKFTRIHKSLKCDADIQSASAVLQLIEQHSFNESDTNERNLDE